MSRMRATCLSAGSSKLAGLGFLDAARFSKGPGFSNFGWIPRSAFWRQLQKLQGVSSGVEGVRARALKVQESCGTPTGSRGFGIVQKRSLTSLSDRAVSTAASATSSETAKGKRTDG
jgi:hypothetical protein